MSAIDRTTRRFVASIKDALPEARVSVQKSVNKAGRSHYVYIYLKNLRPRKIRISDHKVGMRRAVYGDEDWFLHDRATPDNWSIWLGQLVKMATR